MFSPSSVRASYAFGIGLVMGLIAGLVLSLPFM